ncbi:MAG: PepSY domain-containing protein [Coriobacteriales bacterium]|jgi:uncharacterized membrane protein YkoI|nr:PepSY domain-containing protein [Coriobacteriales bacterium]
MKKAMVAVVVALVVLSGCTPYGALEPGTYALQQATSSPEAAYANVAMPANDAVSNGGATGLDAASVAAAPRSQGTEKPAPAPAPAHSPALSSDIGEARAREIALAHAGLNESDVVFVRVQLDSDDGQREYEVEFYSGNIEYDYDINAVTGEIRSYDRDAEYHSPSQAKPQPANTADIGEAKAQQIALSHAGYAASDVRGLRTERDHDDGRLEYDVEFYVGTIEYSYEIDAENGKVVNYEAEQRD